MTDEIDPNWPPPKPKTRSSDHSSRNHSVPPAESPQSDRTTPSARACPHGHSNPPGNRFCGQCGTPLSFDAIDQAQPEAETQPESEAPGGEGENTFDESIQTGAFDLDDLFTAASADQPPPQSEPGWTRPGGPGVCPNDHYNPPTAGYNPADRGVCRVCGEPLVLDEGPWQMR